MFSRVLRTSVSSFLESGEEAFEKNLAEFTVIKKLKITDVIYLARVRTTVVNFKSVSADD